MFEVLTRWTGPNMPNGMVTVMNFRQLPGPEGARASLQTLWEGIATNLDSAVSWEIETAGREFSAGTGQTTGVWSEQTVYTGSGTAAGSGSAANATMVLLQWRTGVYTGGRELRGRTFVPGLRFLRMTGGELSNDAYDSFSDAAAAFVADDNGFSIWSRPKNGSSGSSEPVVAGTVWRELAVLRSRRG